MKPRSTGRSGRSAASAPCATPTIIAANTKRRMRELLTIHKTCERADYCLLTLINRFARPDQRKEPLRQRETARTFARAVANLEGLKSALADQWWRRRRRDFAAGPADAKAEVVGRQVAEFHGIEDVVRAGEGPDVARGSVAEMDPTIRCFNREVVGDLVGETGMHRVGELPLRDLVGQRHAVGRCVDVEEARDGVAREADADADERRNAPPGTEVGIQVQQRQELGFASAVFIGAEYDAV